MDFKKLFIAGFVTCASVSTLHATDGQAVLHAAQHTQELGRRAGPLIADISQPT